MAIIQSGATTDLLTIDPTFKAARTTIKPIDYTGTSAQGSGAYRLHGISGSITQFPAVTATTSLFNFKFSGTGVAIIRRIQVGLLSTVAYTQGAALFQLFPQRGSYTQGTTGGTAVVISGNNTKLRTAMQSSLSTAYIATSGATAITESSTADTTPIASCLVNINALISAQPLAGLVDLLPTDPMSHPFILASGEGFKIGPYATGTSNAFPATGTSNFIVNVEWVEAAAY